ncbi:hypothetical protein PMAG_a0490 [Pseudoalteromonas mariniglutinosa NCIMB 1770]|nr:hypothetical protein [Pseudoalteromonas mariniglutinosa NCIMB 1770]
MGFPILLFQNRIVNPAHWGAYFTLFQIKCKKSRDSLVFTVSATPYYAIIGALFLANCQRLAQFGETHFALY